MNPYRYTTRFGTIHRGMAHMKPNLTLCLLLTIFGVSETAESKVYYIQPPGRERCPQPCVTLSNFSFDHMRHDNVTMIMLQGNPHSLDVNISFTDLTQVEILSNSSVTVSCASSSHLSFKSLERLYIKNLLFVGCGGNIIKNVGTFVIEEAMFKGKRTSGTSLTLVNTTAEIRNCAFVGNQFGTVKRSVRTLIQLTTDINWFLVGDVTGIIRVGGALITSFSNVSISNCTFSNNRAEVGGDIFTEDASRISIFNSTFSEDGLLKDNGEPPFGGSIFAFEGEYLVEGSVFLNKQATVGGAIITSLSNFTVNNTNFLSNHATDHGASFFAFRSDAYIYGCHFENNTAGAGAGVATQEVNITVDASKFISNTAERHAAALDFFKDTPIVRGCVFINNVAHSFAGAVLLWFSDGVVHGDANSARDTQNCYESINDCSHSSTSNEEAVDIIDPSGITAGNLTLFASNSAPNGAALYVIKSTVRSCGTVLFMKNDATLYSSVYFLDSNGSFVGWTRFFQNVGSFFAFNSIISFSGCNTFIGCSPPKNTMTNFKEGGSMTVAQTMVNLRGESRFERNLAEVGGAIVAMESTLHLYDDIYFTNNNAMKSGGAFYLSQSDVHGTRGSVVNISSNKALHEGGAIHAVSSSIKVTVSGSKKTDISGNVASEEYRGGIMNIMDNEARHGGALYLEANSKVTLLKDYIFEALNVTALNFIGNKAEAGGAIYVDDESNSGACASNPYDREAPRSECFIRVVATHTILTANTNYSLTNIRFDSNSADGISSTLFGGLLDRCTVSLFNEVDRTIDLNDNQFQTYTGDGLQYLFDISTGNSKGTISSYPVQVCQCSNDKQNCSHVKIKNAIEIRKGELFNISVIAVDHVYRPVNATIQGSLHSSRSDLVDGQVTQIENRCTNISFRIVSPHSNEVLTLYASDGPCKDAALSRLMYNVTFKSCTCPIGFEPSKSHSRNCECVCHSQIKPFVMGCDARTRSFQRRVNVWIAHFNSTSMNSSGYLVYSYCPFDYCLPPNVSAPVDLSSPHGEDAQCALNRTGTLCGACKPGLSLSLGSSRCLKCPSYWPALFVSITLFAILAGFGLVVFLMWLNITVAVGTINGLLLYANIVVASRVTLLPYPQPNFITIFISWLNLELGIDVCYINGMDTYIKTWLQLAFPTYMILLVALLIVVSRYSSRFSKLIAKRNPVALLATLIFISYGKLFHVVLLAQPFSFASLTYPDGHKASLWLPDGTISYLTGKHIVLFIVAFVILAMCIAYSLLLLCWQPILHCPGWRIFRWIRSPNLYLFMEAYHAPYAPRHRYWTGMLLLVRAVIYLVAAATVSGNPQIQLISIILVMICVILLKMAIATKIFKKWLIDVLESFFYINTIFFAAFTSYNLSTGNSQDGIAYTSVILSFVVTIFIVLYHVYEYTSLLSMLKKSKAAISIQKMLKSSDKRELEDEFDHSHYNNDDDRYEDILDISDYHVSDADYHEMESNDRSTPSEPTSSVIELGDISA